MFAFLWIVSSRSGAVCQEIDNCSPSQNDPGTNRSIAIVAADGARIILAINSELFLINKSIYIHFIAHVDLLKQVSYLSTNKTDLCCVMIHYSFVLFDSCII